MLHKVERGAMHISSLVVLSALAVAAPQQTQSPPSRDVGLVLGWDVHCAMTRDGKGIASCGFTHKKGNLRIGVYVGRSVTYSVGKDCVGREFGYTKSGSMENNTELSTLLTDVASVARFSGGSCVSQPIPESKAFTDLETLLMMVRPFPPTPENKGLFWF